GERAGRERSLDDPRERILRRSSGPSGTDLLPREPSTLASSLTSRGVRWDRSSFLSKLPLSLIALALRGMVFLGDGEEPTSGKDYPCVSPSSLRSRLRSWWWPAPWVRTTRRKRLKRSLLPNPAAP